MRLAQIPLSSEVIAPLNILSLASSDVYKHSNFQHFHKFNSLKITDETVLGEGGGGGEWKGCVFTLWSWSLIFADVIVYVIVRSSLRKRSVQFELYHDINQL